VTALDQQACLHHLLEPIADNRVNQITESLPWHVARLLAPKLLRAA
jgi:hypothetical protein